MLDTSGCYSPGVVLGGGFQTRNRHASAPAECALAERDEPRRAALATRADALLQFVRRRRGAFRFGVGGAAEREGDARGGGGGGCARVRWVRVTVPPAGSASPRGRRLTGTLVVVAVVVLRSGHLSGTLIFVVVVVRALDGFVKGASRP